MLDFHSDKLANFWKRNAVKAFKVSSNFKTWSKLVQEMNGFLVGGTKPVADPKLSYCQTSNISCTLVGSEIVDHSNVVGALLVSAAATISSFST